MLGIIICDDDRFMLERSAKIARICIKNHNLDANVLCVTADTKEALLYIEKNPDIYLLFLDIDFGKTALNGVDIAKIIKKIEPGTKIVFVTNHGDMGMSVLKSGVEAFGFIEKTDNESKMIFEYSKYIRLSLEKSSRSGTGVNAAGSAGAVTDAGASACEGGAYINLLIGIDEYVSLPISQILYVDTNKTISHFICYHTIDGSAVSVRDTIENALAKLGGDFIKSHRSVIINKNYVVAIADGVVRFAGGETAAYSFRLKNEIMKKCGVRK